MLLVFPTYQFWIETSNLSNHIDVFELLAHLRAENKFNSITLSKQVRPVRFQSCMVAVRFSLVFHLSVLPVVCLR